MGRCNDGGFRVSKIKGLVLGCLVIRIIVYWSLY